MPMRPLLALLAAVPLALVPTAAGTDVATVATGLIDFSHDGCTAPGYALVAVSYGQDEVVFTANSGRDGVVGCGGALAQFSISSECTGGPGADLACLRAGFPCLGFALGHDGAFEGSFCGTADPWLVRGALVRQDAAA